MFNLIVSGGLESHRRGTISSTRVLEYTENQIAAKFKSSGSLDIAAMMSLPTILMTEGMGDDIVIIGWLSRIELRNGEYLLQYSHDHDCPRLTNADVYGMAKDLQIDDWEFSRNHWAIKDVDLFQVLYRRNIGHRQIPQVFRLSTNPVRPRLISLMMPFSAEFDRVHQCIKAALEAEMYECQRADNFWVHDHIVQDIIELICTAKVVVCDLSGKNPNVFYEA
jgi:hypothetical protein